MSRSGWTFRSLTVALVLLVAVAVSASGSPAREQAEAPRATPPPLEIEAQRSGTTELLQAISVVDDRIVWVGGHGGTWGRTLDGGTTWETAVVPGAATLRFRDVHAVDAETAWLMSAGPGDASRVFKTDDGGETWRRIPPTRLPDAQQGEGGFATSGTCLTTGPEGRAWIGTGAATAARVLRTTDGGRSWELATRPWMSGAVYGAAWITGSEPPTLVAVGPQGLELTDDDGGSWHQVDDATRWAVAFASPGAGWTVGPEGRVDHLSLHRPPGAVEELATGGGRQPRARLLHTSRVPVGGAGG